MIEINLLPEGLRKKGSTRLGSSDLPIRKILTIAVMVLVVSQVFLAAAVFTVGTQAAWKTKLVSRLKEAGRETEAQKSEAAATDEHLKEIQRLTTRKFYWASLLNALSGSMTQGVWLRSLSVIDERPLVRKAPVKTEKKPAKPAAKKKGQAEKPDEPQETPAEPERRRSLKLEGSVAGSGQETASVGKFLKELKTNDFFSGVFDDIELSDMNQRKIKDVDVYDFVLLCRFKREKAES